MLLLQNFFLNFKIFLLTSLSISFFFSALFMKMKKMIFFFSWEFMSTSSTYLEMNLCLDFFSLFFSFGVLLIASSVLVFSSSYMKNELYFLRFHLIVLLFVVSMLTLIFSSNLIMILLGWDGLGVVSYLLVIFFFSSKSNNAGLLTVMTNRLGDVMILLSMSLYFSTGSWFVWSHLLNNTFFLSNFLVFILILASMTKSAQIPFSAWLPAAMAAPTPVSALVHSSTLVTAGVYLLFRFLPLMKLSIFLNFIFFSGTLTLLMAGMSALYESDMKKMVALSTLSQLGLMFCSLGKELLTGVYFHLLTHAFFKAMLFISVGNMIHLSDDYQDLRKINLSMPNVGFTFAFSSSANWSLMGAPFLSGFFSKDLILELFLMNFNLSWVSMFFFYVGCLLTVIYSFRLMLMINWNTIKMSKSIIMNKDLDATIMKSMVVLLFFSFFSGSILSWILFDTPISIIIPWKMKIFLSLIIPLGITVFFFFSKKKFWKQKHDLKEWNIGILWGLPLFSGNFLFYEVKNLSFLLMQLFDQMMNKSFLFSTWKNYELYSFFLVFFKDNQFFKNFFFLLIFFIWWIFV